MQVKDQLQQAQKGAKVSIIMYVLLTTFKLLFGYIHDSQALVADGLNNATDVVSSVALLIGLAVSMKPADDNHNYGHYRSEYIGSLIASFIMFAVSVQVILQGIKNYIRQEYSAPTIETAVVAILSAFAMLAVYIYNRNLAKKLDSSALKAAAADNLSDALVSLGAFLGIIGVFMGLPFLDTVAAIVVGLLIMKTAIEIFFETAITLTDGFDSDTLDHMKSIVQNVDHVESCVDIKGRNHGVMTFVDVTVTVNPNFTVAESHDITEHIEHAIKEAYGAVETIVHLEPAE
ncbi:cation diffusion facilitator family transporter [Macrococcus armenti]|uniref:cation diffusion facilitator family transporter n=1 Tax=Macrococcus armenti TaxID=2875764 RepID=UPI001CC94421|nr:cation diffusion facilitator family transporter [Macrococcus armenti]UBH14915.1 cation diffusion facilitator family transporter [Macrococcus armenti]UBH17275.1 cation diffusion facilitator family transporter [Macrococcus armenti]UBH19540.1 cation diffusion facilitator family transporter [Macrococcus armenti]